MERIMNFFPLALALLYTIISHELAHGYMALWNGDETAKNYGRLTLNPLAHLDPKGLIFLILFKFGWAKPVPINDRNFKHRRLGLFLVSIAGVTVNFLSTFVAIGLIFWINPQNDFVFELLRYIALYGVFFGVFNLIPIPPLDGSKMLASFLPVKFEYFIYKYERYFNILLLILLFSNQITKFMDPLVKIILNVILKFYMGVFG